MKDLWCHRWKALGLFFMFYALMMVGFEIIPDPYSLVGIIPLSIIVFVFLLIGSSHDGWIAKRRRD